MSSFTYRPLSTPRFIRLLSIAEVEDIGSSFMTCYLTEVSLDSPILNYRALSYTWGDPARTTCILVNGEWLVCGCQKESQTPVPLDGRFTFPTLLWVDAICINQDDLDERAQQVALMQQIYSRASSVLVWLGRATEQTVPAFRLLLGLAEISHSGAEVRKTYIAHVIGNEYCKGHWLALGELLQREWWHRAWTIQEAVLGLDIYVICGPFAIIQRDSQTLTVMNHAEVEPLIRQGALSGLPSWVPNWTEPSNSRSIHVKAQYLGWTRQGNRGPRGLQLKFSFSGESKAHCRFPLNENQMVVKGFIFDTIKKIETHYIDKEAGFELEGVERYCFGIGWKPPTASDQFEHHDYWLAWLGFQTDFPNSATKILRRNGGKTQRMNLKAFKTQISGVMGITDVSMRVGDKICGLLGAQVPYILRPCRNSWVFVGLCHLFEADIMNGVLMEQLGAGKFTLRDFIIEYIALTYAKWSDTTS
ncbi:heterokaryon incompatibility (HET) domain-containing protein [Fusarium globosum]|uniref:Heterokaryon incompatibility (HET) domain-containing protein n=1 Tax=Fusarium globosum TaxID=78864 RepID=A0A8H5Y3A6_9HYPO|nr:heterokaryon incompatibility (HET) domain-containing protein [Fusarium globosum]